jgi:hypothetical protein
MLLDGERLARRLASGQTRGGFLGRLGAAVIGAVGGRLAVEAVSPDAALAHHFCGHIYTTGSCPNPLGLPRIDAHGFPIRPRDGRRIDNLGRLIDGAGFPVDETGKRLLGPTGEPLPKAPRTRLCQDWIPERFGFPAVIDGGWYRCCGGTIRKLTDCCAYHRLRINGDAALTGYCYNGRKVFCVMYYQTSVPC